MDDILRPIYQERASSPSTLGILLIEKRSFESYSTDSFDYILLVITEKTEVPLLVKHYSYENQKAALYIVSKDQLDEWLVLGSNRRLTEWLHHGRIIFDRNENIVNLKQEIKEFPFNGRNLKKGLEFAKLVRRYTDGKLLFDRGHYLDAYNYMVHALHHLARLEVIDSGFYPEVTVWEQVRYIEPQIYKLYEELIKSEESLEKKLELVFLASEFLIYSHMQTGTEHFAGILSEKEEAWTIDELLNHPGFKHYSVDLPVLLEYLIDKKVIEVTDVETKGHSLYHRRYKLK